MITTKIKDYTGYSTFGLTEAIHNALEKANNPQHVQVIETRSSQNSNNLGHYQVILTTSIE